HTAQRHPCGVAWRAVVAGSHRMERRTAIKLVLAAGGTAAVSATIGGRMLRRSPMPVIFLAHGSPQLLDDAGWMGELRAWADALPRPSAVLMLSAHWE